MSRLALLIVIALAFALGCDSPSTVADAGTDAGATTVDPSRTIGSLSLEESRALCEGFIAAQGTPGTVVTCDGLDLTIQSVDDCAASIEAATCTNTVAELNTCVGVLDGDACKLLTDPACAVVRTCATGS